MNEKLLESLRSTTNDKLMVGKLFLEYVCNSSLFKVPFLKLYAIYVSNFDKAMGTLENLMEKNTKFCDFIKSKQCKLKPGLSIQAYLINPVQRIPRYKLLLENLLKHTQSSHPDYEDLQRALGQIQQGILSI